MKRLAHLPILGSSFLAFTALAAKPCPAVVDQAVRRLYPKAQVNSCKPEKDNGVVQYEVRLTSDASKLELDLASDGSLLQTEERVSLAAVPDAVRSAFGTKYSGKKILAAEKQVKADGKTSFELAFSRAHAKHEATFTSEGKFVEEE